VVFEDLIVKLRTAQILLASSESFAFLSAVQSPVDQRIHNKNRIVRVFSHNCFTFSLALWEACRFKVFAITVLRRIFRHKELINIVRGFLENVTLANSASEDILRF
jgi:hypothetical protein